MEIKEFFRDATPIKAHGTETFEPVGLVDGISRTALLSFDADLSAGSLSISEVFTAM